VIFFGFESLLGLFTLTRLGLLGQGNGVIFFVVGAVLVIVQGRYIGKWSARFGDARLVTLALSLLAVGLVMVALTPEQPQPFYVQQIARNELTRQAPGSTEAVLGEIALELPDDGNNGVLGVGWLLLGIIPLAVGAGLIRPTLNSLMTQNVPETDYGAILGVSASFVSAANAVAPLMAALIFQQVGVSAPFLIGGALMGGLALLSTVTVQSRKLVTEQ